VAWNPVMVVRLRREDPATGDPDIGSAVPPMETGLPDIAGTGAHDDNLPARRRRTNSNIDLRIRGTNSER
jgi:hypothetical protein